MLNSARMISQGDKDSGRKEHDTFGEIEVPAGALWGAQTERARFSTMIFGGRMPRGFILAVAQIKAAAASRTIKAISNHAQRMRVFGPGVDERPSSLAAAAWS